MIQFQIVGLLARKPNAHHDREKTPLKGNIPIKMNFSPY